MLFLLFSIAIPNAIKVSADSTSTAITYSFSKSSINEGDNFDINVNVSNVTDLYGASIDLKLDPNVIEVSGIEKGRFWTSAGGSSPSSGNPFFNKSTGDYSCYTVLTGNRAGIDCTGPSAIFVIHAKALKAGSTVLKTISDNSDLSFTGNNVKVKLSNTNDGLVVNQKIAYTSTNTSINVANPILTVGKYEETNSSLTYVGSWSSESSSSYSGNAAKISNTNGSYVTFSFTGVGFRWYGLGAVSMGNAKVTIDNLTPETVNNYSSTTVFNKVAYEKTGLAYGTHTVKIEVTNTKDSKASSYYQVIDSIEILNTSPLTAGKYEETNSNLTYVGSWSSESSSSYSGNAAKISNTNGSYVTFSFTGVGFRWYGLGAVSMGNAKVTIDNLTPETVNNYSSTTIFNKVAYEKTGLAYGTHTVKIEVTNTKDSKASSYYQAIDAIEILNNSSLTAGKYEETNSSLTYVGSWSSESSSSYSGNAAKISNTNGSYVTFSFTGTGFRWYGLGAVSMGNAKVTIDNLTPETVNNYSSTTIFNKVAYEKTSLAYGTHTVKIEVTNTKDSKASSYYQAIDYLQIFN